MRTPLMFNKFAMAGLEGFSWPAAPQDHPVVLNQSPQPQARQR